MKVEELCIAAERKRVAAPARHGGPPAPAAGTVGARDMMEPLTAEVPEEGEMEQSSQPTHDAASVGNDPL